MQTTKYILQRIIIIAITFCSHNFAAQLASYFTRDGLFDTRMSLVFMANAATTFRSVSDKSSVYCHSTCLRRYSVPFCTLVVRQQLHGSHERSMQAVRTISVRSYVPDRWTWERTCRTVKKFSWVSWTTKIFLHENLKHENYITRKFPDLRYIPTSVILFNLRARPY